MNELDFDELDKAVNSLMGGMSTDKRNTALDDPEEKVVSLDSPVIQADQGSAPAAPAVQSDAQSAAVAPTPDATQPAAVEAAFAPSTPARPAQPLAVKRRGQFMDMVHPSSNMKNAATPAPKREGVTVQPSSPFVPPALSQFGAGDAGTEMKPEPSAPVLDVVTPVSAEVEQASAAMPASSTDTTTEWPDPIDLMSQVPSAEPAAVSQEVDVPSDVLQEVSGPKQDEPQTSPFLPDAKVEKRPLGGAGLDEPREAPADTSVQNGASAEDMSKPPEVQLPDELKNDVMALESTSTSLSPQPTNEAPTAATDANAIAPASVPVASASSQPSGSGSIQQQYAVQPSTSDRTNTPIYDTSTHQPLEPAHKKASSVKWVVFLLVVLIIGAIAGAAYFYFTTHK